jgi:hypothetical protein
MVSVPKFNAVEKAPAENEKAVAQTMPALVLEISLPDRKRSNAVTKSDSSESDRKIGRLGSLARPTRSPANLYPGGRNLSADTKWFANLTSPCFITIEWSPHTSLT